MSLLRRVATRDRIFFVTTNLLRNCQPLNSEERDAVLRVIAHYRDLGAYRLFAYCVMPDHLHLLLSPNNKDLSAGIREVKSVSSARIIQGRRTRGSIWQARYFDNIIRRARDFWPKVEYIHSNPVAAGLVVTPSEWRWSSYTAIVNRKPNPIAVDLIDLPADPDTVLWPAPWK